MCSNVVVVVGIGNGILMLWDCGVWDDQQECINVVGGWIKKDGESLDVIVCVFDEFGWGKKVIVGVGDGSLSIVDFKRCEVQFVFKYDEVEGVFVLIFDYQNRFISGGGRMVKVWVEFGDDDFDEEEEEEVEVIGFKRLVWSDFDFDDDSEDECL